MMGLLDTISMGMPGIKGQDIRVARPNWSWEHLKVWDQYDWENIENWQHL